MFNILVTKSGGITGYGEAILKKNGVPRVFETREDAERAADEYRRNMNHAYASASYTAKVIPVEDAWGVL